MLGSVFHSSDAVIENTVISCRSATLRVMIDFLLLKRCIYMFRFHRI